jgi:colicin import membrane protein
MTGVDRMQHVSSGSLALLVHGLLLFGLMIGVSWKNPPHLPIEADIWTELPAPPQPIIPPEFAPQPELLPEPEPLPAPAPAPVPKAALPDQAEIALDKAEKKRLEEELRAQKKQAELQRQIEKKLADEKRAEELHRIEQERVEKLRIEKERMEKERVEKEKREQSRRLIDQELARQMREELDAESSQLRAMQNSAKASKQMREVKDFQERIRAKIRGVLILPQRLKGDAEVTYQVSLLPNGEVLRVKLVRTSGQPLYDDAVERAIFKASPLPLPNEREVAAQFREGLTLKFRPSEDAAGLH